jgi:hypothetical protein
MSYCEGKPIYDQHDNGYCFFDEDIGAIHDNSYIHAVKGQRECRKCRKGLDLVNYC